MKQLIEKIPLLAKIIMPIKIKFFPKKEFTTSNDYWVNRYKNGGNSGPGSYNKLAEFKGEILNDFISKNNIKTVIELGCGDGNQLKYFNFSSYIGFDISQEVIEICKAKFKEDKDKQFFHIKYAKNYKADLLLSLDVIYHLIEDETYHNYMNQLFEQSNEYVIIYSNDSDDTKLNSLHVKSRKFTKWIIENRKEFKLVKHIPNRYPHIKGQESTTSSADFYIYKK